MSLVKRKKQQQQNVVETGKELELFQDGNKKMKNNDNTSIDLPINLGVQLIDKPIKFYIGTRQYQLTKQQKPLDYYYNYMQFVFNLLYGYLDYNNYSTDAKIKRNYKSIIAYIFQTILRYNYIVTPYKMHLFELPGPVLLGEPAKYIINKFDTSISLYFSQTIIEQFLSKSLQYIIFKFSEDITRCDKSSILKSTVDTLHNSSSKPRDCNHFDNQNLAFKLFTIADHLATHYMDEYKTGSTDWISHYEFGNQNYTTTNSVFKINANIINNTPKALVYNTNSKSILQQQNQQKVYNIPQISRITSIAQSPLFNQIY